ncbi:MAG: UvrABC system protein B [Parcubacteria group bacterium GW2011_GWA1_45_7]|nr:MAG: UvrABC system protein B [Parcubacteria group bacterium GW2011_GWA1_45_7]
MGIFKLHSKFQPSGDQPQAITKLIRGIEKGFDFQTLLGVTGSGKTFTMANVISHFDMPVLVIAPNKALAAQLYREYKNFFPENSVNYFVSYYDYYQPEAYMPHTDTYIDKEAMVNEEIEKLRHQATSALMTRRDVIVVASVSCIYNLGVPANYLESSIHLEVGKPITRGDLIRQLVHIHFSRTNAQVTVGTFRVRGEIFECMPASGSVGYRIELEDQKVKELYTIDPLTKTNIETLREIIIFPPKHFVTSEPEIKSAVKNIQRELDERLAFFEKEGLWLEAERLKRRTRYDIEMLKTLGYCHGIENYSRHLSGKLAGEPPDTLLSYFLGKDGTKDFLTIIDESHIAVPQIRGMYAGDQSRKQTLAQYGWRLPSALDNRPLKFNEFLERVGKVIFTSATPGDWEMKISRESIEQPRRQGVGVPKPMRKSALRRTVGAGTSGIVEQVIRPTGLIDPPIEVRPVFDAKSNTGQIEDVMREARIIAERGERMIVNTLTKKMAEDLSDFLIKNGFKVQYMHSDTKTLDRAKILTEFREGKFDILVGVNLLREGLDFPEVSLVAILDADREGFLRSDTSLIQTMGRAARNVRGKVILYADTITGSMRRAMDEVNRRRIVQEKYNKKHGITPQSIIKDIEQLLDFDVE